MSFDVTRACAKLALNRGEDASEGPLTSSRYLATSDKDSENGDMDEGSPPVPVLQLPAVPDVLDTDTRRLIGRFLTDFTGLSTPAWNQSNVQYMMKKVVTGVVDKYRIPYNAIIHRLSLDQRGRDMSFIGEVARNLFADGITNWGRIASLLAFCAVVSERLKARQQECCVELVAQEVSNFLISHQRTWLVQHNAWDGFLTFFKEQDLESTLKKSILAFVGLAGVTAGIIHLLR
ncbi:induced myeloid leukemia cell differentiation protein Mcl-1 homolog [Syngnathus typhle]|uniref:induced myeloid leukemia cell differentiation protein Mcl-1 homolog n=1 Tax=Syngnathus typhle TaxID=161592 RepID=UPI002A69A418|nr:induced myeloid leukemia cell differentiation protein Mcl-1 homolog [Syngnathus typhle]